MSAQRYYRATAAAYEQARRNIDARMGFPSAVAETCIAPSALAPTVGTAVYVAVRWDLCELAAVSRVLVPLVQRGDIVEVSADEFRSAIREAP